MLAARTCKECEEEWFDDDPQSGKWTTKKVIRGGQPLKRMKDPKTGKPMTPCSQCPKKSPAEAHKYQLNERNQQAVRFYRRVRATCGTAMPERAKEDSVTLAVMEVIDEAMRAYELSTGAAVRGGNA